MNSSKYITLSTIADHLFVSRATIINDLDEIKKYIGEVSYYFEEEYREYVLNVIIEYPYRHLGKGKVALELLCKQAKDNGLRFLCDDIETNNPAKKLFLDLGFKEVWARENITMLKKRL